MITLKIQRNSVCSFISSVSPRILQSSRVFHTWVIVNICEIIIGKNSIFLYRLINRSREGEREESESKIRIEDLIVTQNDVRWISYGACIAVPHGSWMQTPPIEHRFQVGQQKGQLFSFGERAAPILISWSENDRMIISKWHATRAIIAGIVLNTRSTDFKLDWSWSLRSMFT